MKLIVGALIFAGGILSASVFLTPQPRHKAPEATVHTCITQADGKIIYAPCLK